MRTLNREVLDVLKNGTREQRLFIFEREPIYFTIYYFSEYFFYNIPDFHFDFYDDIKDLASGEIDEAAWIAFRESAKTSVAKLGFVCWLICFKKKRYINYDSYVKANAEAALFDVAVSLQTNQKIIRDFGHLYFKKEGDRESRVKRLNNFITENGIKVEAFSTQESTRGRVYKEIRPDAYIFDDIETNKTKDSYAITKSIISHIEEAKSGLGTTGCILYLGNYIVEDGVVATIISNIRKDPKKARIRNIPVIKDKKITWPGKYVRTDDEAAKINMGIEDKNEHKVSLESKRRKLGRAVYETEMMNDPGKSGDYVFNRKKVKRLLEKTEEPMEEIAGLSIWEKFDASHRYSGGADTAEGIGADSNASVIIDLSQRPAVQVASYEDADIKPNVFGHEIKRHGDKFGECFYVVEINNTGHATIAALVDLEYKNLYRREVKHKITKKVMKQYGFRTTSGNKHDIIAQFVSAVEDGQLVIMDERILKECYHYRKIDLNSLRVEPGMTRHFDLLTAAALAWEGRRFAQVSKEERKKKYKSTQKPYEPSDGG